MSRHCNHRRRRAVFAPRVECLEWRLLLSGLVHQSDLSYLGAFKLPSGTIGASSFDYGGTALTYNPVNNSLFMVGHSNDQAVAEVAIPSVHTGALSTLSTASVLQPFVDVTARIPNNTLTDVNGFRVGGLMVVGNQLVGSLYEWYDAAGTAVDSHFKLSSLNLTSANVTGLFQVGNVGGGYVGGYMAPVPSEWQSALGTQYVTGQAALNIISRTSAGPALFGFNPAQLGPTTAPITPLVYYPLAHPLATVDTQNPYFNLTTSISGVVFPPGTDSVLFVGSHGTGPYWYGLPDEGSLHDTTRTYKGPHAPPYTYQVWAYDAHDLLAVENGLKQPWEIQPYDVWTFDLPYPEGSKYIGGVAYDAATGRLYVSQQFADADRPVINVFQVGTPAPDTTPPVVSAVASSNLSSSTATVAWTTNEAADTQVEYGTTTSYGSSTALNTSLVTSHSASLSSLAASTTYHYRVKSRDAAGNLTTSSDFTFTTTAPDTTAPTISSISSSGITTSGATVGWTTNEASDSQVEYGPTTAYGSSTTLNTALVTSHSVNLSSLAASATYHYRVKSRDASGNLAISSDFTFTTPSPSSPVAYFAFDEGSGSTVNGGGMTGTISGATWTTAGKYGKALSFNGTNALVTIPDSAALDLTTGMTLEAWVNPSTLSNAWRDVIYKSSDIYYLEGSSPASQAPATGGTFSSSGPLYGTSALVANTWSHLAATYDGTILKLYVNGVQVSSRAQTGLIRTSSGALTFGGDVLYGQFFAGLIDEVRIYSRALSQTEIQADLNGPSPDTTPPTISGVGTSNLTSTSVTIGWTTNEAADTQVEYGTTSAYGSSTALNTALVTSHSVSLGSLVASTTYHYRVKSRDAAGNLQTSGDFTFTTAAPDTTAPTISSIGSSGITASGATVGWTTNEASDTQVEYGTTTAYGSSTTLNTALVTSHSVSLSSLAASTTYHYRVKSRDAAGNLATSADQTFTTTAASSSTIYSYNNAPPLPPSNPATTVTVSTVSQLINAINSLQTGQTISIAAGTYNLTGLTDALYIPQGISNWTVRGATGNRADVIIKGAGMSGSVTYGFWTNSPGGTIADLTIDGVKTHGIIANYGASNLLVHNVRIVDAGDQFIKSNPNASVTLGNNNGIVEYSVFEYRTTDTDNYTNGVDVHAGSNWIVRYNLFKNFLSPAGLGIAGPAVLMWDGSNNTIVEGNTFINVARGISLGLIDRAGGFDHQGGLIENNMFYRDPSLPQDVDVPIFVADSPNTKIYHNTVIARGSYPNAIEYRFASTTGLDIKNNLTDGTIQARDGATATLGGNLANAALSLFVNPTAGDLHLVAGASPINQGVAVSGVTQDIDGQTRDAQLDVGADEYVTVSSDITPPTISGVGSSNLTASGVTIAWTTNETSDTQVEYGTTTAYGSSTTLNTALVTSHSVNLSSLSASTTYHYRVKSRDAAGNLQTSGDFTFTTAAPPDTTPPTISGVGSSNLTASGVTIAWTTNEASDTQVEYGTTTAYGSSSSLNTALVTSHSANLSGLTASTTYHYRVKSRDAAGNLSASSDFTFVTPASASAKFYVVDDGSINQTFKYDAAGSLVGSNGLNSGNTAPRGAASNAAGTKTWILDANRHVYVYDTSGSLLGSWTASGLAFNSSPQGIATNGTDVWIVDAKSDTVFRYAGAASRLSGSQGAASSFRLNSADSNPKGIVTDGTSLWVVNAANTDKVFKYNLSGTLIGSWTIDAANVSPTGITIDPNNVEHIWIVDSSADKIFQYSNATGRIAGSQNADATYGLAPGNTNPQDIADPPVAADRLSSLVAGSVSDAGNLQASAATHELPRASSDGSRSDTKCQPVVANDDDGMPCNVMALAAVTQELEQGRGPSADGLKTKPQISRQSDASAIAGESWSVSALDALFTLDGWWDQDESAQQ